MNNNMIYALYCPINNIPVYVGKTTVGIKRPFKHVKERSHNLKVNEWVSYLKKSNNSPVLVVLESDFNIKYINNKEEYWINKLLNEGHILLNQNSVLPIFYHTKQFDDGVIQDYLSEIRLFIKAQRKINKLTQVELSEKAGVGLRFIREVEQGIKTNFTTDGINKILSIFGNFKLKIEPAQK